MDRFLVFTQRRLLKDPSNSETSSSNSKSDFTVPSIHSICKSFQRNKRRITINYKINCDTWLLKINFLESTYLLKANWNILCVTWFMETSGTSYVSLLLVIVAPFVWNMLMINRWILLLRFHYFECESEFNSIETDQIFTSYSSQTVLFYNCGIFTLVPPYLLLFTFKLSWMMTNISYSSCIRKLFTAYLIKLCNVTNMKNSRYPWWVICPIKIDTPTSPINVKSY